MAQKPYKFFDRRGQNIGGGSNRMIPASVPSYDRKQVPSLQYDTHKNITSLGLAKLRDISRYLFWKYPIVQGALLEQASLSVSHFIPQFCGEDTAWGEEAEAFLNDSDHVFDVRGWPYDRNTYLHNLILHTRIDGTYWTLLTEVNDGFPMVQVIPAHRIGGLMDQVTVGASDPFSPPTDSEGKVYAGKENPWKGSRCIAGAIVNENGTPLAYRLYDDPPTSFVDISARSLFPSYFPVTPDQLVGIPALAVCAFDLQDVGETRDFEKLAQKAAARVTLIETNEAGEPPPGVDLQTPSNTDTGGTAGQGLYSEILEGGVYHYLKAKTGSSIGTLVADRPSANQQAYEDRLIRGCFYGMEWSADFTLDNRLGGAPSRIVVERINNTCEKNQRLAGKTMRRVDGYRIAKAMQIGRLRWSDEWYMWKYQGPAKITADRKYESEIDLEEMRSGVATRRKLCAKRGDDLGEVDKEIESDANRKWEIAGRVAAKHGITIQAAYSSMYEDSPNGIGGQQPENPLIDHEETKLQMDAYGVGVRAGTITPTLEDEEFFRKKAGLPPLSADAKKAWAKDKGVRRPITITGPDGMRAAPGGASKPQPEEE